MKMEGKKAFEELIEVLSEEDLERIKNPVKNSEKTLNSDNLIIFFYNLNQSYYRQKMDKSSDNAIADYSKVDISPNPLVIGVLLFGGTVSLGIGIVGIVLPLLPTTPFLLLSAFCYSKGSKRFHTWLLNNRIFGNYITNYLEL